MGRWARRLEPDPETVPQAAWIFAHRLAGHSMARIARSARTKRRYPVCCHWMSRCDTRPGTMTRPSLLTPIAHGNGFPGRLVQRVAEVGDQVLGTLDARTDPDQVRGDAETVPVLAAHARV